MNKRGERAIVEAFLAHSGLLEVSMHEWDRERPDAIIKHDGEFVGVEVTKVSEATPRQSIAPQQWKAEANRIVGAARASFEARCPETLVVRFEMHPAWRPPSRGDGQALARDLATIVEHAIAEPPRLSRRGKPITLKDPHPDVTWAYIGTTRKELGGHWEPSFANHVYPASAADIQCTADRKDPEVDVYRRAARRVWLLIDCDLGGQGVLLEVPASQFTVRTRFDRVFCCGWSGWPWVEIATTNDLGAG